jgi:hypothetical protein
VPRGFDTDIDTDVDVDVTPTRGVNPVGTVTKPRFSDVRTVSKPKRRVRMKELNLTLTETRYGNVVSLTTRVFDVVRRTLSGRGRGGGRGGATDPHGHQRGIRV